EFGRFWYFWPTYLLEGNSYIRITEKAFEKARENKHNFVDEWTLKKSSRRSSKASKIPKSNILVDTFSHDQNLPPKNNNNDPFQSLSENELKWAEFVYKIDDDTEFINNYEDGISSGEKTKILAHLIGNSRYFEIDYKPTIIE
ncbi:14869_t:CDS:2, partial [Funneliformis geosporum]